MPETIAAGFLEEFDEEMASTRRVLAAVPDGGLDWRPHAKSFTLRRLAGHLAEISSWTSDTLLRERLDIDLENQPENTRFQPASPAQLLERFDAWHAKARLDLTGATDATMNAEWTMTWGGYEVVRLPRRRVLRRWVLNHSVHHRAQLGVYLRLNDVPVPGVYGPSADDR